jgi:hypothetical protein
MYTVQYVCKMYVFFSSFTKHITENTFKLVKTNTLKDSKGIHMKKLFILLHIMAA